MTDLIGKTILHYNIKEKLGSPREIMILKIYPKTEFIISPGKGGISL